MKYQLIVCALVAGCYTAPVATRQTAPTVVAAPRVLRPLLLKVGQWARYSERDARGELGQLWLGAVAAGSCGTWVRAELSGGGANRTWLVCVRDDGSRGRDEVARALVDAGTTRELDVKNPGADGPELDALVSRIVPAPLAGTFGRDDISVPAGEFHEALVARSGPTTMWVHPAVPFSGAVKITSNGRDDVLLGFGDAGDEVVKAFVREDKIARKRTLFATGAIELGGEWASAKLAEPDEGEVVSLAFGIHLTRTLDLLATRIHLDSDSASSGTIGAGVRWSPWRTSTNAALWNDLYLQAALGYADFRTDYRSDVHGAGVITSAGWLIGKGGDWGAGVQLDFGAAVVGSPLRAASTIGLGLVVQLEMR